MSGRHRRRGAHVLHVCTRCRGPESAADGASDGSRLLEELRALLAGEPEAAAIRLNGIDCMSGCNRPCSVALASPGKPTRLLGGFRPGSGHAATILDLAARYRESESGSLV
jgi:predicted metal-binding protein